MGIYQPENSSDAHHKQLLFAIAGGGFKIRLEAELSRFIN